MLCIIVVPSFPLLLNVLLWNNPQAHYAPSCLSNWVGSTSFYDGQCYCQHLSTCVLPTHREDRLITYTGGQCLDQGEMNFSLIRTPVTVCRASHWLFRQHCRPSLQSIRFTFFGLMVFTDATQWWRKRLDFGARLKSRPTFPWTWGVWNEACNKTIHLNIWNEITFKIKLKIHDHESGFIETDMV